MHVKLFQSGLPHKIQFINPQHACTARVTVVGSVCLSVDRNLTSGASVHPEKDIMYSTGNGQFGGISLKPLCYRDTPLPALYGYPCSQPFWKHAHYFNSACIFTDLHVCTHSAEGSAL